MNQLGTRKGVTLVALIITVIIMLILAGVSISMFIGENGIIAKAKLAQERTEQAKQEEQNILKQYEELDENSEETQITYIKTGLRTYLDTTFEETREENQWKNIVDDKNNAIFYGCKWNEKGLYFDGIDDYADLGYQDFGNFTLEVIFETPTLGKRKQLLGNLENGGYSLDIQDTNYLLSYAYMNNEYKQLIDQEETIDINTKYKVTATYNGKDYQLYKNGKLIASSVITDGLLELPDKNTKTIIRC